MKVGDIVARKDMLQFRFKITGESKVFRDMWTVNPLIKYRGFGKWKTGCMIPKNDDRWIVVKEVIKQK